MASFEQVPNGRLYIDGLNGFQNSNLKARGESLPFQCLPMYLNSDTSLDAVIQKSELVGPGSVLYVPHNVDQTNVVWVIFQNFIGKVLNDSSTYQQWYDFIFDSDDILPVNFQVNNHIEEVDYTGGVENINTDWLMQTLGTSIKGEVELVKAGQVMMQFAVVKGQLPLKKVTQLYQDIEYKYEQMLHATRMEVHTNRFQDYSNTINIYCYNGRFELCAKDYASLTGLLNSIGQGISQNIFNNVDAYVDNLNTYLDDATDSNNDISIYGQAQTIDNSTLKTNYFTLEIAVLVLMIMVGLSFQYFTSMMVPTILFPFAILGMVGFTTLVPMPDNLTIFEHKKREERFVKGLVQVVSLFVVLQILFDIFLETLMKTNNPVFLSIVQQLAFYTRIDAYKNTLALFLLVLMLVFLAILSKFETSFNDGRSANQHMNYFIFLFVFWLVAAFASLIVQV